MRPTQSLQTLVLLSAALGLVATPLAAASPQMMRTWTDASGRHETQAVFLKFRDGSVYLEKENGAIIRVPLESLSDGDQQYVWSQAAGEGASTPDSPIARTSPPRAAEMQFRLPDSHPVPPTDTRSQLQETVVTGVGLDPQKALQAAFSQSIEQTVGVLVDSETLIENDRIISDKGAHRKPGLRGAF